MAYNISQPVGSRVQSVKVCCKKCLQHKFIDLDPEIYYRVVTSNYLADGGDGYTAISQHFRDRIMGPIDIDAITRYVRKVSPLANEKDGRIQVIQ